MDKVDFGHLVKVHYTGKFPDGQVFDSSANREPIEFVTGMGQMITGFEQAVIGMEKGEKKSIVLEPADAYGEHYEAKVLKYKRENLDKDFTPEVGMRMEHRTAEGHPFHSVVILVNDEEVHMDANHPMAGKTLHFDLEVVSFEVAPNQGENAPG